MAYDWTGERTRRIQRLKITVAVLTAVVAVTTLILLLQI